MAKRLTVGAVAGLCLALGVGGLLAAAHGATFGDHVTVLESAPIVATGTPSGTLAEVQAGTLKAVQRAAVTQATAEAEQITAAVKTARRADDDANDADAGSDRTPTRTSKGDSGSTGGSGGSTSGTKSPSHPSRTATPTPSSTPTAVPTATATAPATATATPTATAVPTPSVTTVDPAAPVDASDEVTSAG